MGYRRKRLAGETSVMGYVYLLCFGGKLSHAGHYVGWTESDDIMTRLTSHLSGHGAKIVRAAVAAGLSIKLVRLWRADRSLERKIKKTHERHIFCPLCNVKASMRVGQSIWDAKAGTTLETFINSLKTCPQSVPF